MWSVYGASNTQNIGLILGENPLRSSEPVQTFRSVKNVMNMIRFPSTKKAVLHKNLQHSHKNWSAQLGNLLVHSQLTFLVHYPELHFCAQGCAQLVKFKPFRPWSVLQGLKRSSVLQAHKFVCLKRKLPEDVHHLGTPVSKDLKCPSGAQPCSQKYISW